MDGEDGVVKRKIRSPNKKKKKDVAHLKTMLHAAGKKFPYYKISLPVGDTNGEVKCSKTLHVRRQCYLPYPRPIAHHNGKDFEKSS